MRSRRGECVGAKRLNVQPAAIYRALKAAQVHDDNLIVARVRLHAGRTTTERKLHHERHNHRAEQGRDPAVLRCMEQPSA